MRPNLKSFKNIQEVLNLTKAQAKLQQFEELTWFSALQWIQDRAAQLNENSRFFVNSIASTVLTDMEIEKLASSYPELLHRIVLEMTETEQANEKAMNIKISTIRNWGGQIALDDFGTGYSTESVLLCLNPNIVKMDIELVRNIDQDENRRAIAENLVEYCHERNILVVAEGIERVEELETMMKIHVDLFQGFYLARPEVEIRPLNPYVIKKMQELSKK